MDLELVTIPGQKGQYVNLVIIASDDQQNWKNEQDVLCHLLGCDKTRQQIYDDVGPLPTYPVTQVNVWHPALDTALKFSSLDNDDSFVDQITNRLFGPSKDK